jgi:DNA-binding transcriptional LysR family regulator
MPKSPDALNHHNLIAAATGSWSAIEWKFLDGDKVMSYKIKPKLSVTSNDAAIEAAIRGLGITRVLSYQIAPFLASGQVQTLLSDYEPKRLPIHVLHREGRYASAKVRTFVDLMVERLRADQVLN